MGKKRILHIVSHLKKNGTETFIMNLFRAINRDDYKFDFLTFAQSKEGYYEEIIKLGGRVFFLPSRKQGIRTYHKELDNFFKTLGKDYDTIHYHVSSFTSVAPLFYARKYGIKQRIVHVHSANCTGLHNKILHRLNRKRISKLGTDFLACSRLATEWGFANTKALKSAKVITNGIDLDVFHPDSARREKVRENLGVSTNKVILHVGSFNPIKNHKFLLDSFSYLLERKPEARLICVGDGEKLQEITGYATNLGINDKVYFLGRRDDIADLMRAADLFVLPSLYEGLGIVLIEAQASALPSLASTGVPIETKVNPTTTYLPLTAGPKKWAETMIPLLGQRERSVSQDIVHYTIQFTVEQMETIYSRF